jgi:hypothetical protein
MGAVEAVEGELGEVVAPEPELPRLGARVAVARSAAERRRPQPPSRRSSPVFP